jgi:hypothetical protein
VAVVVIALVQVCLVLPFAWSLSRATPHERVGAGSDRGASAGTPRGFRRDRALPDDAAARAAVGVAPGSRRARTAASLGYAVLAGAVSIAAWGQLARYLPVGAVNTAPRSVGFFGGAGFAQALTVLAG